MPADPTSKDRFTALDAVALVRELRSLGAARVEKAFDVAEGGWSVQLHPPGQGKRELWIVPGRFGALVATARPHTEELSPVAQELRRRLTGATVRSVEEPGAERYLELHLSRADEPEGLLLAVEFFGAGNLIVARGGRIAAVTRPRAWAHRTLRVGAPYARAPARADPFTMGAAEIESELRRSRTDLASTLAARLSLGGPVAEELIARGGFRGNAPAADQVARSTDLRRQLEQLRAEIGASPAGFLYRRGDDLVDATPYRSHRWEGIAREETRASFSEAALEYFPGAVPAEPTAEESAALQARRELERQAERQQRAIAELTEAAAAQRADADAILSHFPVVEAEVAKARRRGNGSPDLVVQLGDRSVQLPLEPGPRRVAQLRYDEAKRLDEKIAGARAALAETEARLARPRPVPSSAAPAARTDSVKRFWFERYRWFITSEGAVVIAGRDAASNDVIVRRNLKDGDLYVHADVHGAASVVVKRPPPPAELGEASRREACQWAAAFSKAWRAGYASSTAFWATPDQVSKSGASGEFVARGAWVIHGTKHFVRDVPLELAVGVVQVEGQDRWTVAPETAVRVRGSVRCWVAPGDERDRGRREEELVRELGIDRSLLQSLLPAGGLTVRRA